MNLSLLMMIFNHSLSANACSFMMLQKMVCSASKSHAGVSMSLESPRSNLKTLMVLYDTSIQWMY